MGAADYSSKQLLRIEKSLIERYKVFEGIRPRPLKIVEDDSFAGRADPTRILVAASFLRKNPSREQVRKLVMHELLHYVFPGQGHSLQFFNEARKFGIDGDYEKRELVFGVNRTFLEGRLRYYVNEGGEEAYDFRPKPSWKGFKEIFDMNPEQKAGGLLSALRRSYGLSRKRLSKEMGKSQYYLTKIEKTGTIWEVVDENPLKEVFLAIVRTGPQTSPL